MPLVPRLTHLLDRLCALIAHHAGLAHALVPMVVPLHARLRRTILRLERLAARWRRGECLIPRRRAARRAPDPAATRPPRPRLPARRGWLVHQIPEAAQAGGQLRHLLADPELPALLRAAPQAGRLLRPLCRMLGVPMPEELRPPPRPARPKPAPPEPRPPRRSRHPVFPVGYRPIAPVTKKRA